MTSTKSEPTVPAAGSRARRSLLAAYAPIGIAGALLALVPLSIGESRLLMGLAVGGLLFAAYAIAFNVIFGSTNQLFLCVGALAGIGGYTSGILADRAGVGMPLAMVVAAVVAAAVGGVISWIAVSRSLGVIFTGIITLAFSLAFHNLLLGQRDLTGGETGLVIQAGEGSLLRELVPPYYGLLALVVGYLIVYRLLQMSHIGWAFRALRDDETTAELAGVDVARYRIYAGIIGSAMLGLAGALYAHTEGYIGPSTYSFGEVDVRVLVMLAFGGIGTLLGPLLGAVVFTVLDEVLVEFGQLRVLIYGGLIVVLFLGFKQGVITAITRLFGRFGGQRPA
ncbi:MAG TPA: branched-chain amino acid ABC transporter permease [Acidimicrobiia bacterium]|nr:branched-chain amino acid ABC transporter permease [Acidimicrobiia bacterium]